jgi:hypothetical protein
MTHSRIPIKTQRRIDEIKEIDDTKLALESIVDLVNNYTKKEEKVPVRYDDKTGKPIEYEWRSSEDHGHFKPEIYLGGDNLIDPEPTEPGLAKKVVEKIEQIGPIVVNTQFGKYVFSYEERDVSSTEQGGDIYFATKNSISIRKIEEL